MGGLHFTLALHSSCPAAYRKCVALHCSGAYWLKAEDLKVLRHCYSSYLGRRVKDVRVSFSSSSWIPPDGGPVQSHAGHLSFYSNHVLIGFLYNYYQHATLLYLLQIACRDCQFFVYFFASYKVGKVSETSMFKFGL